MLFVVWDVAIPPPSMLPLNGVEWRAATIGRILMMPSRQNVAETRIILFIFRISPLMPNVNGPDWWDGDLV